MQSRKYNIQIKEIEKTAVIQSDLQPLNITQPSSTIAGQIIKNYKEIK